MGGDGAGKFKRGVALRLRLIIFLLLNEEVLVLLWLRGKQGIFLPLAELLVLLLLRRLLFLLLLLLRFVNIMTTRDRLTEEAAIAITSCKLLVHLQLQGYIALYLFAAEDALHHLLHAVR